MVVAANKPAPNVSPSPTSGPGFGDVLSGLMGVQGSLAKQVSEAVPRLEKAASSTQDTLRETHKQLQELLKEAPQTPDVKPFQAPQAKNPMELFGSVVPILALIASSQTKTPLTASLNAMASAMHSMREGNAAQYKKDLTDWKLNTDYAFKLANWENQKYMDQLEIAKTNSELGIQGITALAHAFNDPAMLYAAEGNNLAKVGELLTGRDRLGIEAQLASDKWLEMQIALGWMGGEGHGTGVPGTGAGKPQAGQDGAAGAPQGQTLPTERFGKIDLGNVGRFGGELGGIAAKVQDIFGQSLTPSTQNVVESKNLLSQLATDTASAFKGDVVGRSTSFFRNEIKPLLVHPGFFTTPHEAYIHLSNLKNKIDTEVYRIRHDILDNPAEYGAKQIEEARDTLSKLQVLSQEYDAMLGANSRYSPSHMSDESTQIMFNYEGKQYPVYSDKHGNRAIHVNGQWIPVGG